MRTHRMLLLMMSALTLAGCQTAAPIYREATRQPEPPEPIVKEVPVPTPQLRGASLLTPNPLKSHAPATRPSMTSSTRPLVAQTLLSTKANATQSAKPGDFVQATQLYDYLPGVVYEVVAAPGHVTTIQLERGERLLAKAAGDTAQWSVGDSHAGTGGESRVLVMVKPVKAGIKTNLVLSTDRRVYQIDLIAMDEVYHSEVRWNYGQELAVQLAGQGALAGEPAIDPAVNLRDLDFGYRIRATGKRQPGWMPKRVFTDGHKTYIAFPRDLDAHPAPPLFLLSRKNEAELVNYRLRGGYYVVDQVIDRAELRLGDGEAVRIEKVHE